MRATGQNFNQQAINRIPTAQGRNTATRMGTGLVNPSSGLKTNANIKVTDKPLSRGGLGGASGGGYDGRQVQDRKYFLVLLKNKNNELAQETIKFKKEIETIQTNNQTFLGLERKYEGLTKEVRELEGTLADYNLAVDKQRAGTRPEDLRSMYEHVKNQNDKIKAHLDALFIERKNQEEQIGAIESQLTEIHQAAEMKLNELDPEQKSEYESLINENRQLIGNINIRRNELEEINILLAQAESKLRLDHTKQKYIQLKEQNIILSRKKEDLEVQTNENNLSFPEARDRLLAKVKEDNNVITNTDKRIKEINQLKINYEKNLKEMANTAEQAKNDEEEKKKYEILYQKDREMSEYIDNFESMRKPKLNEISKIEQAIVFNLEESSKLIFQISEVPNIEDFLVLQKDMDLKNDQLDKAQSTFQALQREYEQRMQELKNFDVIEQKLEIEMKQAYERIKKMQEEIDTKFNRIQEVMTEKERKRQKLIRDRDQLLKMKVGLKDELNSVTYDYELKKQKMNLHEQYNGFTELEKKLALNEGTIYNLKQFIQTRTGDMNYQQQKIHCLQLVQEMNNLLLKHA